MCAFSAAEDGGPKVSKLSFVIYEVQGKIVLFKKADVRQKESLCFLLLSTTPRGTKIFTLYQEGHCMHTFPPASAVIV